MSGRLPVHIAQLAAPSVTLFSFIPHMFSSLISYRITSLSFQKWSFIDSRAFAYARWRSVVDARHAGSAVLVEKPLEPSRT